MLDTLAEAWAATSDETERTAIAVVFDSLNSYGGTIGEVLGVSESRVSQILSANVKKLRTQLNPEPALR